MPLFTPNTPSTAISVYSSAAQSINATSITKIQFDRKIYDTKTEFDAVTNFRFTATVAGRYLVVLSITYVNPAALKSYYAVIRKGGVDLTNAVVAGGGNTFVTAISTVVVSLAIGEYIEGYAYHNSVGAISTLAGDAVPTYMIINKVN